MRSVGSSKSRKPYKITKPRERWSDDEHDKFLEAVDRFGRNWKEIVSFVGTRSVSQVRSHAQKHFIRLEKKGLGSVVPPARRKARWSDKQAPDSFDGSADSDQELSITHRQAGSSSSMSTLDFHQSRTTAGSAAQCTEGSGCNGDYNDCQPISSRQHSFSSFPSRTTSFTSPPTQSIISYAQEFLRRCNSSGGNTPVGEQPSCASVQELPAESRGPMLDMLQQIASAQQQTGVSLQSMSGNVPSSAAVALQQQQLQQLLIQQQSSSCRGPVSRPQSALDARPAFGSWPWQRPATRFCSQFSTHREHTNSLTIPDQQVCPQLDGSFLAECVKPSSLPHLLTGHRGSLNPSSQSCLASNHMSAFGAFDMALKAEHKPSVGLVTPTTSFQSIPSSSSVLTGQPEGELPAELCSAEPSPDSSLGLDDEEFWADFSLEDPLMQAVDAAMGCDVCNDSCV